MIDNQIKRAVVRLIFIAFFLLLGFPVSAQSDTISTGATPAIILNEEVVDFRVPDEEKIIEYQKDSRFEYDDFTYFSNLIDKVLYWIGQFISNIFREADELRGFGPILVYVLAALLIIAIIIIAVLKLKGVKLKNLFGKKKIDTPDIDIYTENVHEMNFDTLIASALKNKDYRLATRFLYLKNLKELSEKSIIRWNINKTNSSYQSEITNENIRSKFIETTFIFDYVWYGEFPVDETQYLGVESKMNDFNKLIANEN